MRISYSGSTDVGRTRDHNEDNFAIGDDQHVERFGHLLVVCDGAGGHAAGEVASRIGVETITTTYYSDPSEDRAGALKAAVERANACIYEQGRGNMLTTAVVALLHQDALCIANVGDSRAYLIREREIRQITRDHSLVSDQVAAGLLDPDEVRSSPMRNVITRALGYQADVDVDMFRMPLQVGDIVLLSSDGLHGYVSDQEIAQAVTSLPLDEAARVLIDLANQGGGPDNITVVLARVDALDWDAHPIPDDEEADESTADDHERVTEVLHEEELVGARGIASAVSEPTERRLNLRSGLLSVMLLAVLIFVTWYVLSLPVQEMSPLTPPPITATARPTLAPSPAGTTPLPAP